MRRGFTEAFLCHKSFRFNRIIAGPSCRVVAWNTVPPAEARLHLETATGMRKTPLNALHRASGAKMVPFGGWDMPVEYSGLISEHMAVRKAAGLFDVSHMGEFEIEGPGALAFLQRVTSNDVARLVDGQAQYSALPMPTGAPVDDVIVYRRAGDRYLLVVNASSIDKDFRWLQDQGPSDCELKNRSDDYALLALQGPRAQEI